ncbi:extracellular solute-binding protein [Anaerocolumna sedimenticola]|uniref:Extracellular solute-binding protein n=1 Tax=Anaerocolumna sedimenticola TaxID=2696063 RepID=A0A6P1TPS9_9FIRM|nr:extracellular solute-binding protein [Anaerocolumna sedimenticola]QHQ61625.1 extracellular solute-binding protein [Anaerocolumna sedimenticola]
MLFKRKLRIYYVGMITVVIILLSTACSNKEYKKEEATAPDNINLNGTNFENIKLPENYNIKQYAGITLNFIVENNLYANILTHESEEFSEVTGININIRPVDFDTLIQKVNLDFITQAGKYQLVYVDPYQTLNRFYNYLEVLNPYNLAQGQPHMEDFMSDFIDFQTEVCSYFLNKDQVYAIPFDSTTMIMFYRRDIFERYKEQMKKELGYVPVPGAADFTWERYCEVAEWINENVPDEEVKYGSGLMAQEHNSIFCEFSNILAAYGGDYFLDENINTVGTPRYKLVNALNNNFIQALDVYKKVASVSAPESVNWNWADSANAFRNGEIAMMANWDENYTYLEDSVLSKVAGKVGYSILPYGDEKSSNIYGGSGIGINKYATETEKEAAWLYIVWATSKDMQLKVLRHPEGGSLPTRNSAYEEIKKQQQNEFDTNADTETMKNFMNAVQTAWNPENIYLRPKTSDFYDVEKNLIHNLHQMLVSNLDSHEVRMKIYTDLKQ